MTYTIKTNRNTVHISGLSAVTPAQADQYDHVGYFPESHCSSLSGAGTADFTAQFSSDDLAEVWSKAQTKAAATSRKICKKCEKAALRTLGS